MSIEMIVILLTGIGLGVLHALDADHVLALLTLNNEGSSRKLVILLSSFWAFGHGSVLLISGVLLFTFGALLPENLQFFAEIAVGLLLIALGINCLRDLRGASLKMHSHGDLTHAHWYRADHEQQSDTSTNAENHKPLMVGLLHGLGGSAPVFALIPMARQSDITVLFSYLLLFSVGVWASMLVFGLSVSWAQGLVEDRHEKIARWIRPILGCVSILFGATYLIAVGS